MQHHADVVLAAVHASDRSAVSPLSVSWRRSAVKHRLDPSSGAKRELLGGAELEALREAHLPLLQVAIPVLDQLFQSVGLSGCGVVLTDARGTILERRVRPGERADFTRAGLVEGARWSEADEGTNGIGTCLVEDRPVVIHRNQHFASRNIDISCMDAPVHDPEGRLVAALDVSSCRDDHDRAKAEMVAALVREAARRIERDCFCRHFDAARIVFAGDSAAGLELLAVDRDDLVIGASRAARLRFALDDAQLRESRPVAQVMGRDEAPSFESGDRAVLRQALARAQGYASAAARALGVSRATFYRRCARAGIRT